MEPLAPIIHKHFCCNRGFTTATRLWLAGSPLAPLDVLFKYALYPRKLIDSPPF